MNDLSRRVHFNESKKTKKHMHRSQEERKNIEQMNR